jgi:hypothetical protein
MKTCLLRFGSLSFAAILLAGALLIAIASLWHELPPVRAPHLSTLIPSEAPNFVVHDEPLGATEIVREKVEQSLKFDDFVYRIFRRDDLEVAVYIAYWGAGKLPIREVAQHTPDRCWTDNGFRCIETRFNSGIELGGVAFLPGDWRIFETPREEQKIWVAFWLMAGSDRYDFGTRFNPLVHPSEWFYSAFKNMRLGRRELYFVRLSSNKPLDSLRSDADLAALSSALISIGIGSSVQKNKP